MSSSNLALVPDDEPFTDATVLATALTDLAEVTHTATDIRVVLDALVAVALQLVPGAQDASVMLVQRRDVSPQQATSTLVEQVDTCQLEVGEGPCLEAVSRGRAVRVVDMGQEARWGTFAPQAHRLGVGSSLSLPLRSPTTVLGALNLFSRQTAAFDDRAEQVGLLLARHAAVALAHTRDVTNLTRAMASRDVIGQAKGRLMERHDIDDARAFAVLVRISQCTHRKLNDVAQEVASTGRHELLPAPEPDGRTAERPTGTAHAS